MVASLASPKTHTPDLFAREPRHEGDRLAAEVCRRVFVPPERLRLYEWAARHRTLATGVHAGSAYDPSLTPYAVLPMDLLTDARVRQVVLPWGTQLGKSEIGINFVMRTLAGLAQSVAYILPGLDRVRDEARDRIAPSIESCAPLAAMMSGRPDDENSRRLRFLNGASLSMHSSGALASLIGRSIPKGVCDEVSDPRFDHAAVLELEERRKAWSPAEHKLLLTSNQAAEGTGIDHYVRDCVTHLFYFVPCPHCGTYQRLAFDRGEHGLRWSRPAPASVAGPGSAPRQGAEVSRAELADEAERTAHYRCASAACRQTGPHHGRIMDYDKPWMLAMGVWAEESEAILSDGSVLATRGRTRREVWEIALSRRTYDEMRAEDKEDGEAEPSLSAGTRTSLPPGAGERAGNPRHGVRVAGGQGLGSSVCLHLSSLYSPFAGATFGQIARKFVRAGRMTEKFCTDWLGEAWRTPGRRLDSDQLRGRLLPSDHPQGYELGTAPDWALAITLTADVQQDRLVVVVRAWGDRGLRTGLVWAGEIPSTMGHNLRELDAAADWAFPVWRRADLPPMKIRALAADSGQGLRKNEVYTWARRMSERFAREQPDARKRRHARSLKGESSETMRELAELTEIAETKVRGTKVRLARAVPHLRVNSPMGKALVYAGLGLAIDAGGDALGADAELGAREYLFPAPWDAAKSDPHLAGGRRLAVGDYLSQITAEEYVRTQSRADAAPKHVWRTIGGRENHALDCEVYQVALAHAFRVDTLRAPAGGPGTSRRPMPGRTGIPADAGDILRGRA